MSRVAKKPIVLPQGVAVDLSSDRISVKGPLGALEFASHPAVTVEKEDGSLSCKPVAGVAESVAMSGTMRAVVANMVTGVSAGFERKLSLVGVGYRAQAQGDTLNLTLGFSHPVAYKLPEGHHRDDSDADRNRHQGCRPATRRPGGRRGSCLSSAGALQRQGCALCRRSGRDQRNEEEEVRVLR
jgi:hypothetical protein